MKKNQGDEILIAIHNEAGGFFGRFGINDPTKLHAFVAFMVDGLGMQLLIGDDAPQQSLQCAP